MSSRRESGASTWAFFFAAAHPANCDVAAPLREGPARNFGAPILALNAWTKSHAAIVGVVNANHFSAVADSGGGFKDELSVEGRSPNPWCLRSSRPWQKLR